MCRKQKAAVFKFLKLHSIVSAEIIITRGKYKKHKSLRINDINVENDIGI